MIATRPLAVCVLVVVASGLVACASDADRVPVAMTPAPAPSAERLVALEVGDLLAADPVASAAAESRLVALDRDGRAALLAHAERIPGERDPRWLHVLDENHALMPLTPEEQLAYLLWKAARPEDVYVMKAQGRLVDLARREPDLLLARLDEGGRGAATVALALALAGERRAVLPLLARYRAGRTPREREVAAEALSILAGEQLAPRVRGAPEEIEADARQIARWYQTTGGDDATPR